jgi:hypothetical protein
MAREAATFDEIAASIEHIKATADEAGRNVSTLGFRTSIVPTPPVAFEGAPSHLVRDAVTRAARLVEAGVTHVNIPWNYYPFTLEDLGTLLAAIRGA